MKMDIVESDLKQLFMWTGNLQKASMANYELCKTLDGRLTVIEQQLEKLAIEINYFLDQEGKYLRDNK